MACTPISRMALTIAVTLIATLMPESAQSGEWRIPLAGNAYRTAPALDGSNQRRGGRGFRRSGELVLQEQATTYSVYFHADRDATVEIAVKARAVDSAAMLRVRCGDQSFDAKIDSDQFATNKIGSVSISGPGYTRVDLSKGQGDGTLEISDLIVTTKNDALNLDFVKNNDGNMFYWGRRGPSVHLRYDVPRDRNLQYAYSELTIPEGEDPIGSYFMANGFGEGYFGIQVNSPTERRVLFSVWSPFKTDNPRDIPEDQRILALAKGPEVRIGEFGNEGSGGQSFLVYPWKAGTPYRFLTEVRPDGNGNTIYTCWFGEAKSKDKEGTWRLIASFRRPQTDTHLRGFHSFLENFNPSTGHIGRRVNYSNVWVRDVEGQWHECTDARFSVDATGRGRHRLDFTGGADGDSFYLRNCGFINETGTPGETFTRQANGGNAPDIDLDSLPRE